MMATAIESAGDAIFVYSVWNSIRSGDKLPRLRYVIPACFVQTGVTREELYAPRASRARMILR
jgi:hypothetical protein